MRVLSVILLLLNVSIFSTFAVMHDSVSVHSTEQNLVQAYGKSIIGDHSTDLFTGRFQFKHDLLLPPARSAFIPNIDLQYTSARNNGPYGVGWSISLPYIERNTKKGVPVKWGTGTEPVSNLNEYDETLGFVAYIQGGSGALVPVADPDANTTEYRLESNGASFRFFHKRNLNIWEVIDNNGNKLCFGETQSLSGYESTIQEHPTWTSTTPAYKKTFRWNISSETDVALNRIKYYYESFENYLYPYRITYNESAQSAANIEPNISINFFFSSVSALRSDSHVSYIGGFSVKISRLLEKIEIAVKKDGAPTGQVVLKHEFSYAQSSASGKNLLKSISVRNPAGNELFPSTDFEYYERGAEDVFSQQVQWNGLESQNENESPYWNGVRGQWKAGYANMHIVDLFDIDGDGLPDRIMADKQHFVNITAATGRSVFVQRNTGSGFLPAQQWWNWRDSSLPVDEAYHMISLSHALHGGSFPPLKTSSMNLDLNGDGLPDRLMVEVGGSADDKHLFKMNTGLPGTMSSGGFGASARIGPTDYSGSNMDTHYPDFGYHKSIELKSWLTCTWLDMNGDGLPDRLFSPGGAGGQEGWLVRHNTGFYTETGGLTAVREFGNSGGHQSLKYYSGGYLSKTIVDMNGDGLPDRVTSVAGGFEISYNNGYGFEGQTFVPIPPGAWEDGIEAYLDTATTKVLVDVNNDGLPDVVMLGEHLGAGCFDVSYNTGVGFTSVQDAWGPLLSFDGVVALDYYGWYVLCDFVDINGDGYLDIVRMGDNPYTNFNVQLNNLKSLDLLKSVNNATGGKVEVEYEVSSVYNNRDKDWVTDPWAEGAKSLLPYPLEIVKTVTESDTFGEGNTVSYNYKGGFYNAQRREFAGFNMVEVTQSSGVKNRHWFHQGGGRDEVNKGEHSDSGAFFKAGIQYRHELIDSDGILRSLTLNKIESASLYTGVYFTYPSKSVSFDYANSTDYLAKAQSFVYDTSTGNLTKQTIHGKVQFSSLANHSWSEIETKWTDVADDEVYQHVTYHGIGGVPALANASIRNRPATLRVTADNAGSSILKESLNEYYGDTGKLKVQRERICAGSYVTNGFKYDIYGNTQYITNQVGIVAETVYDTHYKTLPRQNIVGSFVSYNFYEPAFGKQIGSVDLSGLVTTNILDEFYRLVETRISTTPNAPATEWLSKYTYAMGGIFGGVSGNFMSEIKRDGSPGGAGHETRTYFDGLGRAVQIRTEADPQSSYTAPYRVKNLIYDDNGQVKYEVHPYFGEGNGYVAPNGVLSGSYNQYDAMERLWKATPNVDISFTSGVPTSHTVPASEDTDSPTGPSTFAFVDGSNPWAVIHTDPENKVRKYYLDAHGRTNSIVEVNDGSSYTSQLQYDKLNRLLRLIDHSGNIVEWQYDDLGNRVAMSDPHLGIWKWQHDFAGRIREQTDGNGNVTKFFYKNGSGQQDPLGRLLKCEVYGRDGILAEQISYVYDTSDDPGTFPNAPGKLIAVHDGQGWERKKYDLRGRVIKQSRYLSANTGTYTIEQDYDELNRIKKIIYPGGAPVVEHEYDAGANLYKMKRTDGSAYTYYTSKGYDAMGQSKGAVLGNSVETAATFFPKSKRLQRLRTFKSGTDLQNLTYQYTKAGNVNTITDNVGAHSGGAVSTISSTLYDDLHRLKSATGPGFGTYTYSYDALGNMTQNTELSSINYTYGSVRPHAVKSANGQVFAYDQCGNMVLRGAQVLAYDARNRLSVVSSGGASTTTFGYGHDNGRLWKQGSAGLHIWIGGIYEDRYGVISFHVSANGKRVCTVEPATGNMYYLHGDHLGSSSILTTATGAETRHWEYNPYGRERSPNTAQSFTVSQRFTGQILDDETGLYYYNARYYDPNLARFIQADTIIPDLWNPQTYNRYAYALNNPLRYTDPSGHEADDLDFDPPMTLGAGHAQNMRAAGGASAERYNQAGSDLKAVASGTREVAEMNPIVGFFNSVYQLIFGKDAVDNHQLSGGERAMSAVGVGAVVVPPAKIVKLGKGIGGKVGGEVAEKVAKGADNSLGKLADDVPTIGGRKPINSAYAGKTHPSGVKFNSSGFPDFAPFAKAKVELDGLTGNYAKDSAMANKVIGLDATPDDFVWHHVEDGKTMLLVPQDIHQAARHTGGSAVIRNGGLD